MITVKVKSKRSDMRALYSLPKEIRLAAMNAQRYAVSELKKTAVSETVQKYYLTKGQITKTMTTIPGGF